MNSVRRIIPFLLLLLVALGCKQADVQPAEKDMFVRGGDFSELGIEVREPERYEKFSKTAYFDGSVDIEYEFEPPESEAVIYLTQTITYEPKKADARLGRAAEDGVIGLALKAQGLEKVEIPNFYKYGDASDFYILKKDGNNVGNYFTVLEGGKIFSLLVSGVYIDDVETWRDLVEPKLKLFSSYNTK